MGSKTQQNKNERLTKILDTLKIIAAIVETGNIILKNLVDAKNTLFKSKKGKNTKKGANKAKKKK